jgi:hypothetical protein
VINYLLKYKDTYYIIKSKTENKSDNYIPCRKSKGQIYRYSSSLLAIQFTSNGIAKNRIKELSEAWVQLTILQHGDNEQVYTFKEDDLDKVAEVVGAKKRVKLNLTEEQREERRTRLQKALFIIK